MAYQVWSVVFGEQPSASKWNILGTNDAGFHDGTNIDDDAILQRHIADDQILPAQLTSAARWFEELGRTTLGSASDTISVASFTGKKYLRILVHTIDTGGTTNMKLQFNGDTGNNYSNRNSTNGAADATQTSADGFFIDTGSNAGDKWSIIDVVNRQASPKLGWCLCSDEGTSGAANAPTRRENVGKWQNTSAQITSLLLSNSGGGDYASGSEVVVLGHD